MVSRLAAQKGFDIVAEAVDRIMRLGVGMVVLGEGEPRGLQKTYGGGMP